MVLGSGARLALPAAVLTFAAVPAQDLRPVGVAAVDITPAAAVRLSGYGNRRDESAGTAQRIRAKAIAIGADPDAAVWILVESCAVTAGFGDECASRIAEQVGVPRERIALSVTHTHTAPMLAGTIPNLFSQPIPADHQARIDRYTERVAAKLETVALDALRARRNCRLERATGRVGFARNRRTSGGVVDHDLPVLRAVDEDGQVRALVANYACHCTTLGGDFNRVCGDWAGYAMESLEAAHDGATALVTIGCGGDQNPHPRTGLGLARQHGRALADEVARLMRGPWQPVGGALRARLQTVRLPFDPPPTRAELVARAGEAGAVGYHARVQLQRLDRGESLREWLDYPVQTWAFGSDLAVVLLGGEVVVDYALRLKRELDADRLWVTAYSNDVACYIPSERVLREGGYEGGGAMLYYDQPTRLRKGLEDTIVATVRGQLGDAFAVEGGVDVRRTEGVPPRRADRSRDSIRVPDGLSVELVASEPLVVDPIAIDFGVDGRLWVVEMRDYPDGLDGDGAPGGRVKCLFDRDGDGRFDDATVFLDGLPLPTDVTVWRDGVLVCAAPDVLFAADRDGDGVADERRVLFSGFATHNHQARVNSLTWGLDNVLHGAGGLFGGAVRSTRTGEVVEIQNRDFRLDPDAGWIDAATGRAQQGRRRDDQGEWFGCDNSTLCVHYPLAERYARRNPHAAPPPSQVYVPKGTDPKRLFPVSRLLPRFNDPEHLGRVTSACGLEIYRDEWLGADYSGDAFVCEPVHNLVHRIELARRGATFEGRRAPSEAQSEFLASTDPWFRPVQVRTGPDGSLWVVDMYRFLIEHPRWVPPERLATLDARAGASMGRIYRVVSRARAPFPLDDWTGRTADELVAGLDDPNGVRRDRAHRLLVHRQDRDAVPALAAMVRVGVLPAARLQALCALDGLDGGASEATLLAALGDEHAAVRRHAVRLCEPWLDRSTDVERAVVALAEDDDPQVRLQVACSLGEGGGVGAARALAQLLIRDRDDPFVRGAVLSSAVRHADAIVAALASEADGGDAERHAALRALTDTVVAVGDSRSIARLMAHLFAEHDGVALAARFEAVATFLRAFRRGEPRLERMSTAERDVLIAAFVRGLPPVLGAASRAALDGSHPVDTRLHAVSVLGGVGRRDDEREVLAALLSPRTPVALQRAAVEALGSQDDPRVPDTVLGSWSVHAPALRAAILDVLASRESWALALLQRAAEDPALLQSIDPARRQALRTHDAESVRARAAEVLGATAASRREAVVDDYRRVGAMRGDAERGVAVFARACGVCHRLGSVGTELGPDLASLSDRSVGSLLVGILDPNRAVLDTWLQYVVTTGDGRSFSARIESEATHSVTLQTLDGTRHTILRSDIRTIESTGLSLMPEGLESQIDVEQMADLIAFLRGEHRERKSFPGNEPVVVSPGDDGTIQLSAKICEIYGNEIRFESPFSNIGYWHDRDDAVVWTVEIPRAARFDVVLEWACADAVAGDAFVLEGGDAAVRGVVAGTGGWDRYRSARIGSLALPAGRRRLTFRAEGAVRGALLDLRAVRLVPGR